MRLRMDGSEKSFEDSCERVPFAPLVRFVVTTAEATAYWMRSARLNGCTEEVDSQGASGSLRKTR
jgi:hypothetical protein